MTFTVDEISTGDKGSATNSVSSASSRACFTEAYLAETYRKTQDTVAAVGREVRVIGGGAVLGAMDKCRKDPVGAALQVGASAVVGAGLGTLAVAESPLIAGGAVVAGIGATGVWAVDTFGPTAENQHRFGEMGRSVKDAWLRGDEATLARSMKSVRDNGGALAFDLGLMASGAGGARVGGNYGVWALKQLARQESLLVPVVVPGGYKTGWFGRGDLVPSLEALFQNRHGKVSTYKGTPDTVEALCKQLDLERMLVGQEKHSNGSLQTKIDWSREVLVPPVHFTKRGESLYFQKYYTEQR